MATLDFNGAINKISLTFSEPRSFLDPSLKLFIGKVKGEKSGNTVYINATSDNLPLVYKQLQKILSDLGCEITETSSFSDEVAYIKNRDQAFEEFSQKTADIWQRKVVAEELSQFEAVISNKIKLNLTPLQFLSALHLAISQNSCNFSVPGAGKTIIVYSAFAYLNSLPSNDIKHIDRLVVIGPLASYIAWQKEFGLCFNRPIKSVRVIAGMPERERRDILRELNPRYKDIELVHVSFQTAVNCEDEIRQFLSNPMIKTMLVIDEAHNIKREDGIWASTCIRLSTYASSRVILTGTPAPNGYEDLANLFKFLYPERNLIGFPRANLISMSQNKMSSEAMRSKIRPFFTRITKQDLQLPEFKEHTVKLTMGSEEESIYRSIEDAIVPGLFRDDTEEFIPFQRAKLIRLRQAVSNPGMLLRPLENEMYNGESIPESINLMKDSEIYNLIKSFNFEEKSEKFKYIKELCIKRVQMGQKILIWSYFISSLDSLETLLKNTLNIDVWRISGETPSDGDNETNEDLTREKIIRSFIEIDKPQILIANPQALGESVSLHYSCHMAIYFDRDFNCGRFIQSKDRIHRYGLGPNVLTEYFYLSYENTIDEDIASRLTIKEQRMNDLLECDEIPLFKEVVDGSGDKDDINAILKSYADRRLQ